VQKYVDIAHDRMNQLINGILKIRPMNRPVYDPDKAGDSLRFAPWEMEKENKQMIM
jgi:adenine-specific DNA-methyltransferase